MSQPFTVDPSLPGQPGGRAVALRHAHALRHSASRDEITPEGEDDSLDLRDLFRVVRKYKWMLVALTLVCGLIAVVQSLRSTPQYRSTTLVQIDRAAQRVVSFATDVDAEQQVWDDGSQFQTQIELLNSRALAERVITEMGLNRRRSAEGGLPGRDGASAVSRPTEPADRATKAPPGFLDRILSNYRQLNTPSVGDPQTMDRNSAVEAFRASVAIDPVRNSRLVNIVVLAAL